MFAPCRCPERTGCRPGLRARERSPCDDCRPSEARRGGAADTASAGGPTGPRRPPSGAVPVAAAGQAGVATGSLQRFRGGLPGYASETGGRRCRRGGGRPGYIIVLLYLPLWGTLTATGWDGPAPAEPPALTS